MRLADALREGLRVILINVMVLGALLICIEAYFRLFDPQVLPSDPQDSLIPFGKLYRLKPGFEEARGSAGGRIVHWRINSKGIRDGEIEYEKPAGTYRIVGLGDSFTFGFTVEEKETFLHRLEQLLNANGGVAGVRAPRHYETVNMGVGGYSTAAADYLLEKEGFKYSPDLVVLALFVGNDVQEVLWEHERLAGPAPKSPPAFGLLKMLRPRTIKDLARRTLHLYSFITVRLDKLLVKLKLRRLDDLDVLRTPETQRAAEGWRLIKHDLARMKAQVDERGAQLLVVAIPMRLQVYPERWRLVREAYALASSDFDLQQPQKHLARICRSLGLHCLDLLPVLRAEPRMCYNAFADRHLNAHGHEVVARAIYERLSTAGP